MILKARQETNSHETKQQENTRALAQHNTVSWVFERERRGLEGGKGKKAGRASRAGMEGIEGMEGREGREGREGEQQRRTKMIGQRCAVLLERLTQQRATVQRGSIFVVLRQGKGAIDEQLDSFIKLADTLPARIQSNRAESKQREQRKDLKMTFLRPHRGDVTRYSTPEHRQRTYLANPALSICNAE